MQNPDELRRLSALLDQVLDLPEAEREAWLSGPTALSDDLGPTLRRLMALQARGETADLLARGPAFSAPPDVDAVPPLQAGASVGPYRLLRPLGQGGMGEVWLAERADGTLRREVALKLPVLSARRQVLVQRFARERDILASLVHPHIARLYDAGLAADGQPYLAMEFVQGQPITAHADAAHLDARARVRLLQQVMDAVQFAHANLVIHRDLKPANVMITDQGQARLLDFGIAKLLVEDSPQAEATELTRIGGRALTLRYAAPEQVAGGAVSTATDVWALGVLLYQLLSGRLPFEDHGPGTLERAIGADDPPRPSSVAAPGGAIARLGRSSAADLDTVVLKALRKLPAERYATVAAFNDDLQRWLQGEPVLARPDKALYRLRRLLGRHRAASAAAALVLVTVLGATAVSLWQARQATRQAQRALAVQAFLLDLFRTNGAAQADPVKARQTTARQLLDRGADLLATTLLDQPASRLILAETLGDLYADMGLWTEAARLTSLQLTLARRLLGDDDPQLARALIEHARSLDALERDSAIEVMPLLQQAEQVLDRAGDQRSELRGRLHLLLADHLRSLSTSQALDHADRALRLFARYLPRHRGHEAALAARANGLLRQGQAASAAETIGQALDLARQRGATDHELAPLMRRAGEIHHYADRDDLAEPLLREALAIRERLDGPHGSATVGIRLALARLLVGGERRDEARSLADQALSDAQSQADPAAPDALQDVRRQVAEVYWNLGDLVATRRLCEQTRDEFASDAAASFEQADTWLCIAMLEMAARRPAPARQALAKAQDLAARLGLGATSPMGRELQLQSIELLLLEGQAAAALQALGALQSSGARLVGPALQARVLAANGQGERARAVLDAALAAQLGEAALRPQTGDDAELLLASGRQHLQAGRCDQALTELDRALAIFQRVQVPGSPQRTEAEALRRRCAARPPNGPAAVRPPRS